MFLLLANGSWVVSGSSVTLGLEGEEPQTLDFCVEGDVLKLHIVEEDVTGATYVLNRM